MALPTPVTNFDLLLRNAWRSVRAQRATKALHTPAPPDIGWVLDVGSGQAPIPRADVIVDKYVADNFERASDLVLTKPLVVGDAQALPFASGTFAYVVASHVLEHATDPHLFAFELSRVAKAGWVQVPSRESELTFGWAFHPWLIDLSDSGQLVFNPRGHAQAPIGRVFHEAARDSYVFRLWMAEDRSRWYHSVHWRGQLTVEATAPSAAEAVASLDVEETVAALRGSSALGPTGALRQALRCPLDGGQLKETADRACCKQCGACFPVVNTVPILLAEAAA